MCNFYRQTVLVGLAIGLAVGPARGILAAAPEVETFILVSGAEVGPDSQPYFTAGHGHHGFFGRGGAIDGEPNPPLRVTQGDTVKITLLDLDQRGQPAQLAVPALGLATPQLSRYGESATLTFTADRAGTFPYFGQTVFEGGNRHVHMAGEIVVEPR